MPPPDEELLTLSPDHTGSVRSAAFSPDGERIVTASYDNTAKVWDAATGDELLTLSGHSAVRQRRRLQPRWSTHRHRQCRPDRQSGTPPPEKNSSPLQRHGAVWSAAFSPDGQRIVTASRDNTAKVWECPHRRRTPHPLRPQGGSGPPPSAPMASIVTASERPHRQGLECPPAPKSSPSPATQVGSFPPPSAPMVSASSPPVSTRPPKSGMPPRGTNSPPSRPHRVGLVRRLQPRWSAHRHHQCRRTPPKSGMPTQA